MKSIFKIVSVVILLAALAGGAYLVSTNQNLQRGAAAGDSGVTILPSKGVTSLDKNVVLQVWVNTGKATDKLTGANLLIKYKPANLKFVSFTPNAESGYTLLNASTLVQTVGVVNIRMVAMDAEKAGAINLGRLIFTPTSNGSVDVIASTDSKLMISGQSAEWNIGKALGSKITIGGGNGTIVPTLPVVNVCGWCGNTCKFLTNKTVCPELLAPAGKSCVANPASTNASNRCKIVENAKSCKSNNDCSLNEYCYMPPRPTGKPVVSKTVCKACTPRLPCMDATPACPAPKLLAGTTRVCPKRNPIVTSTPAPITKPISCGWCGLECRNTKIMSNCPAVEPPVGKACLVKDNVCEITDISGQTPTVSLTGRYGVPSVPMGTNVMAMLKVDSGTNKVSVVKTKVVFDPSYFKIIKVIPMSGVSVMTNTFDVTTGTVNLYLVWNGATAGLPTSPEFATVELEPKQIGPGTFNYDYTFANEVSGVGADGVSRGFVIGGSTSPIRIFIVSNETNTCMVCPAGVPAHNTGNANCDSAVNSADFEVWRHEMFDNNADTNTTGDWKANFDCSLTTPKSMVVDTDDFEIWRATVFN